MSSTVKESELAVREREYQYVYDYLDKYMSYEYKESYNFQPNGKVKENRTIWICWFQGLDKAPLLVKKCVDSVMRNKPEDFSVILINWDNLYDYIFIPSFIQEKVVSGNISLTHFSDIIRTEMLYQYGGCWIDATVYCSDMIPRYMLERELFVFKWSSFDKSILKMSSWWLCAKKMSKLLYDMRSLLYGYWINEQELMNYFLFHIIFSKLVDNSSFYRNIYLNVPYFNNSNSHVLCGKLALEYNEEEWKILKDTSRVHKLTYKRRFMKGDIYNYYSALLEDKLV